MQQIVDLQTDPAFQALDVALVSIAFDTTTEQSQGVIENGIDEFATPMLSDNEHTVSTAYDVLQWAVATGEPGHTFVLVDADGKIAWIQDYGAPQNRGVMYVPVEELVSEITSHLKEK